MNKKIAFILVAILAISAFGFVADASAMPFMNWRNMPIKAHNQIPFQQSYVLMVGNATAWGSSQVSGLLQAQSRTTIINNTNVHQGFSASAIWTTNGSRPISAVKSRENFTYTFYTARLANFNTSALDTNGNSFFMNGTWNVWNVTSTFTIVTDSNGNILSVNNNQSMTSLATQAYGELTVPTGWTSFTLAINGIEPLTGTVVSHVTASRAFNPFMLGDDGSTTVTTTDLHNIAKSFGSMPGWGNYDQRMDYAMHYKIDIYDLSTAAANLNANTDQ